MDPRESTLHMTRWTVTSGSNANSRGAVVIAATINATRIDIQSSDRSGRYHCTMIAACSGGF